jgi:hypothetical protein
MSDLLDYPLAVLVVALMVQSLAAYLGEFLRKRRTSKTAGEDFGTTLPAALTLLGLILGFSFSMAVSRYDQRKSYEEAEANAIGTEYVRASLLPTTGAAHLRELLARYTHQRILFYEVRDEKQLRRVDAQTASLQESLWSAVSESAAIQRDPVSALVVAGMNDVLNSQGYTQAAWWNRIPLGAWFLMWLVAIACNLLVGYSETRTSELTLLVLPCIVAVALFLISDIDSPRHGIIRVLPQNLIAVVQSFKGS